MSNFKPGQEYKGITCKHCGVSFPIFDQSDIPAVPFRTDCPRCHEWSDYQPDEIQSLLAHRKQ